MVADATERANGTILGVHVAGVHVYLALRSPGGDLDDREDRQRIEPSSYMDSADSLYDFCQRFQQLIRECRPGHVAFLHTRNYRPNSYSDAFRRASIESAVMIAARAEGTPYSLIRQEDVARLLSLPAHWTASQLANASAALISSRPRYWAQRALAFAAAATQSHQAEASS
jgi:hypothetical protein